VSGFGAALWIGCARTPPTPFPAGMANFYVLDDLEEQRSTDHEISKTPTPAWLRDVGAALECSQHYCGPHLCSTKCLVDSSGEHADVVLDRLISRFGRPQRSRGGHLHWKRWVWDWAGADEIFGVITLQSKTGDPKGWNGTTLLFDSAGGYPKELPGIGSCVQHYILNVGSRVLVQVSSALSLLTAFVVPRAWPEAAAAPIGPWGETASS